MSKIQVDTIVNKEDTGAPDFPIIPYGNHKIKESIKFKEQIFPELTEEAKSFIVNNFHWYYKEFYPEVLV